MTFREEVAITLLDKLLLTLLVGFIAFKLGNLAEVEKNKIGLETELVKTKRQIRIQTLEKQLSEFYWPMYLRLQKDNVLWKRIKALSASADTLPAEISKNIERAYIIKNHNEMVSVIDKNIYLAQLPPKEFKVVVKYTQHVAIYNAILLQKERKYNPIDLKEPFPNELFPIIENNLIALQAEYNKLVKLEP